MSKYSIGPWRHVFTDDGIVVDANGGKTDVARVVRRVDDAVETGNAKLLAAAPELKQALTDLLVAVGELCAHYCASEDEIEEDLPEVLAACNKADELLQRLK
jgi:hypothetical protein